MNYLILLSAAFPLLLIRDKISHQYKSVARFIVNYRLPKWCAGYLNEDSELFDL